MKIAPSPLREYQDCDVDFVCMVEVWGRAKVGWE